MDEGIKIVFSLISSGIILVAAIIQYRIMVRSLDKKDKD